jgi:predicted TPR repeat methyltransferase
LRIAAKAFAEFAPDKAAAVIDIGGGTGLVGQAFGYRHIDGIEFSAAMLNVARPKAI